MKEGFAMGCLRRLLALTLCGGMLFALPARAEEEELSLGDVLDLEPIRGHQAPRTHPCPRPQRDPRHPGARGNRNVLDIAYNEWETLGARPFPEQQVYLVASWQGLQVWLVRGL